MQIANNNKLHWQETEVFCDGMIQQRGYFDVRMDFEDSEYGELRVNVDDPMDVIPDPDASGYDPKTWSDVLWLRWLTLDEIEETTVRRRVKPLNQQDCLAEMTTTENRAI